MSETAFPMGAKCYVHVAIDTKTNTVLGVRPMSDNRPTRLGDGIEWLLAFDVYGESFGSAYTGARRAIEAHPWLSTLEAM